VAVLYRTGKNTIDRWAQTKSRIILILKKLILCVADYNGGLACRGSANKALSTENKNDKNNRPNCVRSCVSDHGLPASKSKQHFFGLNELNSQNPLHEKGAKKN